LNQILKKLKLSNQNPVLILNAPEEFKSVMSDISSEIHTGIQGEYDFIIFFAKNMTDLTVLAKQAIDALKKNGYLWVCYPKGTSKKYKADINRDIIFEFFGQYNFQGVMLVAIDNDWSAFRVKPAPIA
jgi:hypothetical protein